MKKKKKSTPFHLITRNNGVEKEVIELFLNSGASNFEVNNNGENVFHHAWFFFF